MNWRLILGAVVLIIIIASAVFIGSSSTNLSGFSIFGSSGPSKNITISTSLALKNIEFTAPSETLTLELYSQDNFLIIGNQKIDLETYTIVELENFNGKVAVNDVLLTVDGNADKIYVNGVGISGQDGSTHFSLNSADYNMAIAEEIVLPSRRYDKSNGEVYVDNGNSYFQINDELLELGTFKGKIEITETNFFLDGIVDKILIDGKSKIIIDQ